METLNSRCFRISRRSDVQIAAVSMQRQDDYPGLSDMDRTTLGTVVSELGSNILKYGGEGSIRISQVIDGARIGILVEAHDQGPGIPDVGLALQEHFSTGDSLGLGLPAVQRMSDELDISTKANEGTHVRALRWVKQWAQADVAPCTLSLEHRIRACYPERLSGDQVLIAQQASLWLLGVVDGCGHGPQANAVACAVVEGLKERFTQLTARGPGAGGTAAAAAPSGPLPAQALLEDLLRTAHARAHGSRGAAIGLSLVDGRCRKLWFSGIGNTRILQFQPHGWTGVSRDGLIGDRFPTPIVQCFPLHASDTVVQFSDGLAESQVRQLRQSTDPSLPLAALADLLMSQAHRSDDASLLLLRCRG